MDVISTRDSERSSDGHEAQRGKGTLVDQAYALIKSDIIACEIAPGSTVTAQWLHERYQISLMPVRSALERLIESDWVASLPQRGYRVAPITVGDIVALYDLVESVSPKLARLSAGRVNDRLDVLRRLAAAANPPVAPTSKTEIVRMVQAGSELLGQVRVASGNRYAIALTLQITERLDRALFARLRVPGVPVDYRRDFTHLIDALARGDGDAAEAASLASVRKMRSLMLNEILTAPGVSELDFPRALQPGR
ncbi:GntR family transcriptional regulator [Pararhodobacter sp.]|uniref:GntR family transcriptional regulator n=1 Tax=Pararhodobacter sp. TaxID=2127056 RepID=UPI002AFFC6C0|nr:GntR family transcriptional regulator [Pararhodobacter sp.]